jgi:hypothetical protein
VGQQGNFSDTGGVVTYVSRLVACEAEVGNGHDTPRLTKRLGTAS